MNDPKEEYRESTTAEIAEVGADIATEGILDGTLEVAGAVGETVLDGVGSLLGGLLD